MSLRIGILNNLRAGRDEARMSRVLRELRGHPDVFHLETSSKRMVPEAISAMAEESVDVLAVNGGDGTLQHVLTELLTPPRGDWMPLIAPIRGGRTNMTALSLGAGRDPARAVSELARAARHGDLSERVVERPVLRVDLGDGTGPRYGMFFGPGLLHRAIQLTHRAFPDGRAQGVFGAALVMGTLIARAVGGDHSGVLDPDKMQIALDRTPQDPGEFVVVLATTLDRLILRLRPFWGTVPGPMHVTTLASGARGLASAIPGLIRGRPPSHATPEAGFRSCNVHRAAFRLDCGVTLDGELFDPEPGRLVELRAEDRVRFLRT